MRAVQVADKIGCAQLYLMLNLSHCDACYQLNGAGSIYDKLFSGAPANFGARRCEAKGTASGFREQTPQHASIHNIIDL
jgi:hypothetical protein